MLLLKLEILPLGDASRRRTIGEVAIHNVGGDDLLGRYRCYLSKSGFANPSEPRTEEIASEAHVSRFARSLGAWALVAKVVRMLVQKELNNA